MDFLADERFAGLKPFEKTVGLSNPTMHGEELRWISEAFETNWVSTVGENINEIERQIARLVGIDYAVALSCGTAALHLAVRLAGEKLYGQPKPGHGTLEGRKAFCSDMTFFATVNPVAYEGGESVFIDTERDTWNMDPAALERAFSLYPDVRLIVIAHLYGIPGKIDEIKRIAQAHGALIVEDAAESLGATYKGAQTGTLTDIGLISFNGNKIITGSSGGMLLTRSREDAAKARKWSTQSREDAPWYQHEEMGFNYRMSNIIAGVVRGQLPHLQDHLDRKREIWNRYERGLAGLPLQMNPWDRENSLPNFWLSCILIDPDAMAPMTRGEKEYQYRHASGKSSPQEIWEALAAFHVESRPIWKPMHMQPIYAANPFVTRDGIAAAGSPSDVGADIFSRGLCLPSDVKMTAQEQDRVIEIIRRCFG